MKNLTDDQIITKAIEILRGRMLDTDMLSSPRTVIDFLTLELGTKESESFCVIYLTSQLQIITFEEAFRGTIDGASVYPREIVKAALLHNASTVIFAHNHPSGVAEP